MNGTSQGGGSGVDNSAASQTMINTGQQESQDMASLTELKDLFNEIKRVMDKNLELSPSIEQFKNLIGVLKARYLA